MQTLEGMIVRRATLDEIFQVRLDVLRPGRPVEAAQFPGDHAPETIHAGAFEAGGRNIACATFTRVDWRAGSDGFHDPEAPGQPAWQLRGMGVVAEYQKKGVGQMLLVELEKLARAAMPIRLVWCNGRKEAVEFYRKMGWAIASKEFIVEDVGPHFKMTKRI